MGNLLPLDRVEDALAAQGSLRSRQRVLDVAGGAFVEAEMDQDLHSALGRTGNVPREGRVGPFG